MKLVAAKCPRCGANIKVDEGKKSTSCEYCHAQILVEDAIKLEVEIKNLPKVKDLLKLADRYLGNEEYDSAFENYSKALELEPDNSYIVFRSAFCKAVLTDNTRTLYNGIVDSISLIKEDNTEVLDDIINILNYLTEYELTKNNLLQNGKNNVVTNLISNKVQSNIMDLIICYSYIVDVVDNDYKKDLLHRIIDITDILLKNKKFLSSTNRKKIMNMRNEAAKKYNELVPSNERIKKVFYINKNIIIMLLILIGLITLLIFNIKV